MFLKGSIIFRETFFLYLFFNSCFNSFEEKAVEDCLTTPGRVWREGCGPQHALGGAGPAELRGRVSYNPVPTATGQKPPAQTERSPGHLGHLNISFFFLLPSHALCLPRLSTWPNRAVHNWKRAGRPGTARLVSTAPLPQMPPPRTCQACRPLSRCKWAAQSNHHRRHAPFPAFQTPT